MPGAEKNAGEIPVRGPEQGMFPMIEIEHLYKMYNGVYAVDDLTTTIPGGEIYGLLGPNGAGKSTTILMLIGLIEPTAGRCIIDGMEVARKPIEVKKKIGYMPEDVGFYSGLSADENLAYFGRLYRMERAYRQKRVPDVISLVGLDGVTKNVGEFSKGMRQRLGLAKALLNEPSVVILDEPTANLDPRGVTDYRRIIRQTAESGTTVVVCSHILEEVSRVCSSVGILVKGKLIAEGAWKDLASRLEADRRDHVTIRIETRDPLPELSLPGITELAVSPDRLSATITAATDIRDDISDTLARSGIRIRGLIRENLSIEEMFLSYYQMAG